MEVQNESGRRLGKARLPEGITGIARLHAILGVHYAEDTAWKHHQQDLQTAA